ncbi:MAG: hypothetical protein IPL61_26160 [Myxococcales bacterium]|nr:hypothetical protein [Myxococcales bacterium]
MGFTDWWIPGAELEAGEVVSATWLANHSSANSSAGGKLELTDRRLRFRPSRVDRALGSRVWSVPFAALTEVGRAPRTWHPFNGGLRTRLRLATTDGAVHLFVVNGLARVIAAIDDARAAA